MIETGLRTWLLTQSEILSQLQGSGAAPVFIEDAEANAREYILITVIGGDYQSTIDPNDQAHRDLIDEEVDLDVKCETAGKAKQVAGMILDALFPAVGDNVTGTFGDRLVEAVYLEDSRSGYEPPASGEKKGRHVTEISLRIQHRSA